MPYKYIGRTTNFKGKSLWEILGNLKNFGIGRIIIRNRMQRYPEKSYMKILKVEALPNPENVSLDNMRKVRVWVERTFRNETFSKPILMEGTTYKSDYVLIPKWEEEKYVVEKPVENIKVLPRTVEFPPTLKELVLKDIKAKGETIDDLKLPLAYNSASLKKKYRIAEEGEKMSTQFTIGLGTPATQSLYKNILK